MHANGVQHTLLFVLLQHNDSRSLRAPPKDYCSSFTAPVSATPARLHSVVYGTRKCVYVCVWWRESVRSGDKELAVNCRVGAQRIYQRLSRQRFRHECVWYQKRLAVRCIAGILMREIKFPGRDKLGICPLCYHSADRMNPDLSYLAAELQAEPTAGKAWKVTVFNRGLLCNIYHYEMHSSIRIQVLLWQKL